MFEMKTAEDLWALAWPDVPWDEASPRDQQMYRDHAASLQMWKETNNVYVL
jgi:hypothetical protein